MDALKNAGQWDNTIGVFSSDNGGALHGGNAGNNYPFRAGKLTPWEGGLRVPMFFTGGWIDNNAPNSRTRISDTFFFSSDWAPTLLQMVGADPNLILQSRSGASYRNAMWQFIRNSLDPTQSQAAHQNARTGAYSERLFFEVSGDRTMKSVYTGNWPQPTPRLNSLIDPKTGQHLLMDFAYYSVSPCRPQGVPTDCCYFNVVADPTESSPIVTDCANMLLQGQNLYIIEAGCLANYTGGPANYMCVNQATIQQGATPEKFSLWSQYCAIGPMVNSQAQPIFRGIPMQCICDFIDPSFLQQNVTFYALTGLSPSLCSGRDQSRPARSVSCDGTFAFTPNGGIVIAFEAFGFNRHLYDPVMIAERIQQLQAQAMTISQFWAAYIHRAGYREWPNYFKFPFNVGRLDSCQKKGIFPAPWLHPALTPYLFSIANPKIPFELTQFDRSQLLPLLGLCHPTSLNEYYCPTHQNPLLRPIIRWSYQSNTFWGTYNGDGSIIKPMKDLECSLKCQITPNMTAYIGGGPLGLVVADRH